MPFWTSLLFGIADVSADSSVSETFMPPLLGPLSAFYDTSDQETLGELSARMGRAIRPPADANGRFGVLSTEGKVFEQVRYANHTAPCPASCSSAARPSRLRAERNIVLGGGYGATRRSATLNAIQESRDRRGRRH